MEWRKWTPDIQDPYSCEKSHSINFTEFRPSLKGEHEPKDLCIVLPGTKDLEVPVLFGSYEFLKTDARKKIFFNSQKMQTRQSFVNSHPWKLRFFEEIASEITGLQYTGRKIWNKINEILTWQSPGHSW